MAIKIGCTGWSYPGWQGTFYPKNLEQKNFLKFYSSIFPKTKDFVEVLKSLGLENKKSLFVLGDTNNNVYLSSRNLSDSEVITNSELNTYKILRANNIVLLEGSLEGIESNLNK